MGVLTRFLQQEFSRNCPSGWQVKPEAAVVSPKTAHMIGFSPRADIVFEKNGDSGRIWIELEVSRADPVANHTKFATVQLFEPHTSSDAFVAMVSNHVARGRRNLGATTIILMRHLGINAFQTSLLPMLSAGEVKRLNHLPLNLLSQEALNVRSEIDRLFKISQPISSFRGLRVHFVANTFDVLLNVHNWNKDILSDENSAAWGKRTITYFAYDPWSKTFAPSKFCAYVVIQNPSPADPVRIVGPGGTGLSIQEYTKIDLSDRRFDGNRARLHLIENLGFRTLNVYEEQAILRHFLAWFEPLKDLINIHPKGPLVMIPSY